MSLDPCVNYHGNKSGMKQYNELSQIDICVVIIMTIVCVCCAGAVTAIAVGRYLGAQSFVFKLKAPDL